MPVQFCSTVKTKHQLYLLKNVNGVVFCISACAMIEYPGNILVSTCNNNTPLHVGHDLP